MENAAKGIFPKVEGIFIYDNYIEYKGVKYYKGIIYEKTLENMRNPEWKQAEGPPYGAGVPQTMKEPQTSINKSYEVWVDELKNYKFKDTFQKHDDNKLQWHLLPWEMIEDVVVVLTAGEKKYPGENWKKCTDKNRYMNALDRHLMSWREGCRIDEDSGESHLIHAVCNLLFLAWLEDKGKI